MPSENPEVKEKARPSDSISFELSELDRGIVDLVPDLGQPTKWPAINSIRHLNRSWLLRETDTAMAVFRGITAEEEAGTALFWSLERRRYTGADRIQPRNHVDKNSVIPFIDAVSRVFARVRDQMPETHFYLDLNAKEPRLQLQVKLPHPETRELTWGFPDPPLSFSMSYRPEGAAVSRRFDFKAEIKEVANETSAASVTKYLEERANKRNRVLYAARDGYPEIEGDVPSALQMNQRNVFAILMLCLYIDPYAEHQEFVQHSLDAFLAILDAVRGRAPKFD